MGSGHTWRGAPEEIDPWRQWIRENIGSGPEGYVFEDVDMLRKYDKEPVPWMIVRHFSPRSDPVGKLMAIERKLGDADMGHAQIRTFGLWDHITRKGDPLRKRWMGWYLLNHSHENPAECTYVTINGIRRTMDELLLFLKFELDIPPYEFPDYVKM